MTPETALALQRGLLVGYVALLLIATMAGIRWSRLRPLAFAVGVLSATHMLYYALFLVYPGVLDAAQTMLFSIVLRYQVLFTTTIVLVMGMARGRWRN
jgi:hypothetical protein